MRRVFWRIMILFVTFAVGVLAVSVAVRFWPSPVESIFVVKPVSSAQTASPRFSFFGHACGNGYIDGYDTDDGQRVDDGVAAGFYPKQARREFLKRIREAKQVIERDTKYRPSSGKVGERVVILNKPDTEGREPVSIFFYDGGDHYRFIDAPNLPLALEFEQYLIREDLKFKK